MMFSMADGCRDLILVVLLTRGWRPGHKCCLFFFSLKFTPQRIAYVGQKDFAIDIRRREKRLNLFVLRIVRKVMLDLLVGALLSIDPVKKGLVGEKQARIPFNGDGIKGDHGLKILI